MVSVKVGDSTKLARAMISKDGECVPFKDHVKLSDTGVKEWLKALENEMKNTLALLLRDAVSNTDDLPTTTREDAQVGLASEYPMNCVCFSYGGPLVVVYC